ncbi:MAG TPA: hypothetical protein DEA16_01420 [Opitutae bacterium]|jgi:hypothetical protein|nr:hypothetical protein [Opitutae bacterium]HBR66806.1 hypothetical protein [Opitutae bacterium]
MKEKPIFEEVFAQLINQPNLGRKLLIGSALSFIPILNLFAFGYLYRLAALLRRTGQLRLPEWTDWAGLFADGLKFAVVWLAYWLLPLIVGILIATVFSALGLGALAYIFVASVFLAASVLFCAALYRLQMRSNYRDLLDVMLIVRMSYMKSVEFILPVLVFAGICAVALPFYGFAFFAGFLLLVTQTSLCYRLLESGK